MEVRNFWQEEYKNKSNEVAKLENALKEATEMKDVENEALCDRLLRRKRRNWRNCDRSSRKGKVSKRMRWRDVKTVGVKL